MRVPVTKAATFNLPTLLFLDVCGDVTEGGPARGLLQTTAQGLLGFVLMGLSPASIRLLAQEGGYLDLATIPRLGVTFLPAMQRRR